MKNFLRIISKIFFIIIINYWWTSGGLWKSINFLDKVLYVVLFLGYNYGLILLLFFTPKK